LEVDFAEAAEAATVLEQAIENTLKAARARRREKDNRLPQ